MAAMDPWRWFLAFIARQYPEAYEAAAPIGDDGIPNHSFAFRLLVALSSDGHWLAVLPGFAPPVRRVPAGAGAGLDARPMTNGRPSPRFDDRERRRQLWEQMLTAVRSKTLGEWREIFDKEPDVWAEVFRRGERTSRPPPDRSRRRGHLH